jgi:hypothetical protein
MKIFSSPVKKLGTVNFPVFSGLRIQMMPVLFHNLEVLPEFLKKYKPLLGKLFDVMGADEGVGFLTIDESFVAKGKTHRRPGIHMDHNRPLFSSSAWYPGCGGEPAPSGWWPGKCNHSQMRGGMILVSNQSACCQAWDQDFFGNPNEEGDCINLSPQLIESRRVLFEKDTVYWMTGLTVHESLPAKEDMARQLVRLDCPSSGDWYSEYTPNPKGILPQGKIVQGRQSSFINYLPQSIAL